MKRAARLFGRGFPKPRPDATLAVIGDVHGRADLFARILDRLEADAPDATTVTVGDYVDRGPDSAECLELARARCDVALAGNHEAMMLGFLADPLGEGPRWLRVGGRETLASFGIAPPECEHGLPSAAGALHVALGKMEDWVRRLPHLWRSGNVCAVHAAADPGKALDAQKEENLLWGHPEFARRRRDDGQWVVHGHNVVRAPAARNGRISLDTGAYRTGCLSAAIIDAGGGIRFVQATDR